MTMQPERPERAAANDRAEDEPSDVGSDRMHPHPQDRSLDDEAQHRGQDNPDDDDVDDQDDPGNTDDEFSVDRYRDSPGAAALRPMSAPGEVPEPNEPA